MSKTILAVYDNKIEAEMARHELMRHGFITQNLPVGRYEVLYRNKYARAEQVLSGMSWGFVFATLLGLLVGLLDSIHPAQNYIRDLLFGLEFFGSLRLPFTQALILSWGVSIGVIGMVFGGILSFLFPSSYLSELRQEREEIIVAVPAPEESKSQVEEILGFYKPTSLASI